MLSRESSPTLMSAVTAFIFREARLQDEQNTIDVVSAIGPSVVALAYAEGLTAHAESVSLRMRTADRKE